MFAKVGVGYHALQSIVLRKFLERVNTLGTNLCVGSLSGWPIAFFFLAASSFDIRSSECIRRKCSFILSFRLNCLPQSGQENSLTSECLIGRKKYMVSCIQESSTPDLPELQFGPKYLSQLFVCFVTLINASSQHVKQFLDLLNCGLT